MNDKVRTGDRVVVTDLRDGSQNPGVVEGRTNTDKVVVRYDAGGVYAVGESFVRKADA